MTPKTLEEFIEKRCEKDSIFAAFIHDTAAEILRVVQEWFEKDKIDYKGSWEYPSAHDLIVFLKSYIEAPVGIKDHARKRHEDHKEAFEKLAKEADAE